MTRTIKIKGREATVFKMDLPEMKETRGRTKTFERQLIESLRVGEATDVLNNRKRVENAVGSVKAVTGRAYVVRKWDDGIRVFCIGRAKKDNVLNLRRSQQIAA